MSAWRRGLSLLDASEVTDVDSSLADGEGKQDFGSPQSTPFRGKRSGSSDFNGGDSLDPGGDYGGGAAAGDVDNGDGVSPSSDHDSASIRDSVRSQTGGGSPRKKPVFVWVSAFGTLFAPAMVVGRTKSGNVAVDLIDAARGRTVRKEVSRSALQDVINDPRIVQAPPSNLVATTRSSDYTRAAVLYTLRWRHAHGQYFTACGQLLVSVNPCAPVPAQFSDEAKDESLARAREFTEEPHLYNLLAQCVRDLGVSNTTTNNNNNKGTSSSSGRPQCVAFAGISCSGKSYLFCESLQCVSE
jgi:hypothetical protein